MDALRKLGFSVVSIHRVGGGCPDLLVGKAGKNWLMEIKNPEYSGELTDDEREFFASWKGQVDVVATIEEALEIVSHKDDIVGHKDDSIL